MGLAVHIEPGGYVPSVVLLASTWLLKVEKTSTRVLLPVFGGRCDSPSCKRPTGHHQQSLGAFPRYKIFRISIKCSFCLEALFSDTLDVLM